MRLGISGLLNCLSALSLLMFAGCGGGSTYSVGGTITGLSGTVVLQNNSSNNLSVSANGAFIFPGYLTGGSAYNVTVLTQPAGQSCSVSAGSGSVNKTITSVVVTCTITTSRYAYVANAGSNNISQFNIGTDGALTAMITAKVSAGTNPYSIAIDPAVKYAYVANSGSNNVSQYIIGTDGALAPMSTTTVDAGTNPYSVTVDPLGLYAYVANFGSNNISQYTIGKDGALKPMDTAMVAAGTNPYSVTVDRLSRYVYVANAGSNSISQYTIEPNGSLKAMNEATVASGMTPYSVAIDPSGNYAYVANSGSNDISQYTISTDMVKRGSLVPMTTATVSAGSTPYSVKVDPKGKYVYVANAGSNRVSQYTISTATGTKGILLPMSTTTVSAGATPRSVTVDSLSQYVYATNYDGKNISQYTIDTSNTNTLGALTPNKTAATVATDAYPIFVITVH
jgi:6-phosphogluconolactonase (cycloisomerase 2 family)